MPILKTENPDVTSLKGMHLCHTGVSNCAMRVRIILEEKGLEWVSHEINMGKQENLQDWYLAINPKGLVPAIVHDGLPVTESIDILRYIEERFPTPSLMPSDPDQVNETNEWIDRATAMHVKAIKTFVYGTTGGASKKRSDMKRYGEIQPDKELVEFHQKSLDGFTAQEVENARKMLEEVFVKMEARLADHTYLVGDSQSLADIAWVPQYVLLGMIGFDLRPYPAITAWAKRQEQRPYYESAVHKWLPKAPFWLMRQVQPL